MQQRSPGRNRTSHVVDLIVKPPDVREACDLKHPLKPPPYWRDVKRQKKDEICVER